MPGQRFILAKCPPRKPFDGFDVDPRLAFQEPDDGVVCDANAFFAIRHYTMHPVPTPSASFVIGSIPAAFSVSIRRHQNRLSWNDINGQGGGGTGWPITSNAISAARHNSAAQQKPHPLHGWPRSGFSGAFIAHL